MRHDLLLNVLLVTLLVDLKDIIVWWEALGNSLEHLHEILRNEFGVFHKISYLFEIRQLLAKPLVDRLEDNIYGTTPHRLGFVFYCKLGITFFDYPHHTDEQCWISLGELRTIRKFFVHEFVKLLFYALEILELPSNDGKVSRISVEFTHDIIAQVSEIDNA